MHAAAGDRGSGLSGFVRIMYDAPAVFATFE
jgi:hypothetical protein